MVPINQVILGGDPLLGSSMREFSKAHPEVTYDEFIKANM